MKASWIFLLCMPFALGRLAAQSQLEQTLEKLERELSRLAEQVETTIARTWSEWENKPWLGLRTEPVRAAKAARKGWPHPYGAYVVQVLENSPAAKAGIRPFDYIIAVDGTPLDRTHALRDLLANCKADTPVVLTLIREGRKLDISVRPGRRADFFDEFEWQARPTFLGLIAEETPTSSGVRIRVVPGSLMDRLGLQNGDIITAINGTDILDRQDLRIASRHLLPGDSLVVTFLRGGKQLTAHGIAGQKSPFQSNKPWLGVEYTRPPEWKRRLWQLDNPHGILVTRVLPASPAARAGVRALDYLWGIDGEAADEASSFTELLLRHRPGELVELHLTRRGKDTTIQVSLAALADRVPPKARDDCQRPFLGVELLDEHHGQSGIRVGIVAGAPADEAGMKDGDLLVALDGIPILEWSDLTLALRNVRPGQEVTIDYERAGKRIRRKAVIRSRAEVKRCPDCNCEAQAPSEDAPKHTHAIDMRALAPEKARQLKTWLPPLASMQLEAELAAVQTQPTRDGIRILLHADQPADVHIWLLTAEGRVRYAFELKALEGSSEDFLKSSLIPLGTSYLVSCIGQQCAVNEIHAQ